MRPVAIKVMPDSKAALELARAADVVERVRRGVATTSPLRKGCEKARKMLNAMIVDLLDEE